MNETIGFIGLGNMGGGMAKNLALAGFTVLVFDVDATKGELRQRAGSVAEIAEKCNVVILCLPHPDVTQKVIFEELLTGNSVVTTIIETSTLTPEIVQELSSKLAAMSKGFLSAPMIGGSNSAINKTIQFLVEGNKDLYDKHLMLFEAMGSRARFMGEAPSATLAKLTFNLCRYANLATAVEAYRLLQQYGANTESVYEFMSEQSLDNFGQVWAEDMKEMMTKDVPFKPSQVPKKDLTLLGGMANSHGLDGELIKAIKDTYLSLE